MGFYIEMTPSSTAGEYHEGGVPGVFWALYAFAGFALTCMGLAAHTLLGDLARVGGSWDRMIVWGILAAVPFYLAIGVKLLGLRKFAGYRGDELRVGFRLFGVPVLVKKAQRAETARIEIVNQRPSPNLAQKYHDDPAYQIRGHWRIIVTRKDDSRFVVDKHTEKGALEPLTAELQAWLGSTSSRSPAPGRA